MPDPKDDEIFAGLNIDLSQMPEPEPPCDAPKSERALQESIFQDTSSPSAPHIDRSHLEEGLPIIRARATNTTDALVEQYLLSTNDDFKDKGAATFCCYMEFPNGRITSDEIGRIRNTMSQRIRRIRRYAPHAPKFYVCMEYALVMDNGVHVYLEILRLDETAYAEWRTAKNRQSATHNTTNQKLASLL